MLKHKIQPTLKSLVRDVRGTTWTQEESKELVEMLTQIMGSIQSGTKPTKTQAFAQKIKSALGIRKS